MTGSELTFKSLYKDLLEDADFKRWFDNVKRGSVSYAYESLRKVGYLCSKYGKTPRQMAAMGRKQATNFVLDLVGDLEREKLSGATIANYVKAVKSWLDFNGIHIEQRVKIRGRDDVTRVADERLPTPEELRRIFNAADLRKKPLVPSWPSRERGLRYLPTSWEMTD